MPASDLAAFTTVFRAADAHRVKRNRQPVSCTACQRRKSKCDRQKPCGACEKRGDASTCHFGQLTTTKTTGGGVTGSGGHASGGSSSNRHEVQARLTRLEEMVMGLAASGGAGNGKAGKGRGKGGQSGIEAESNGMVKEDGADASYHGATSWSALVDSIRDIQSILETSDAETSPPEAPAPPPPPAASSGSPGTREDLDIVLGGLKPLTIEDVRASLPSRSDANRLVMLYFGSKFLAVPFIHAHHFRRRYEAFWEHPESTSFLWMSIMFTVFSTGVMIAESKGLTGETFRDTHFYIRLSAQCLVTGRYLEGKPYSVEALMLFAHQRNLQQQDSDATIWSLYVMAVRLAQRRGYHLDAAKVSPHITPFEAEMRRRTWFMVQTSDLLVAFQLGMPPTISEDLCDAGHPRCLNDDDFDEDTPVPPSRPLTAPMPMGAWRIKSQLGIVVRKVLYHVLMVTNPPPPYSRTMALQAELERYYAGIPACYTTRPIRSTAFTDESYTIMHRIMLEVMYRKTLCVLHRPFLSSSYKGDARYARSREICRDAAVRILAVHQEFDLELRPGGRIYEDRIMVSNLTMHHFLLAAMILCIDLAESTDISPDVRATHIQRLQTAHAIWSSHAVSSLDAAHACRVLRAMLRHVDPGNTFSSSSASSVPTLATSNNATPSTPPPPPPQTALATDFGQGPFAAEFAPAVDFDEVLPLDSFFGGSEGLDWVSLDQYLRNDSMVWNQEFQYDGN